MSFDVLEQMDLFEVTNGHFRELKQGQLQAAEKLGCTGKISAEAVTKTIVKRCEGKVAKEVTVVEKLNGVFTGHMPVGILRKVFGLTDSDLKTGVYGYGKKSVGASGAMTFDVYDIGREHKKLISFPNISFVDGLKFEITNGQEEIAEVEINFSAMFDSNGYCYYEAFEADIQDETIKTGWNKTFTPELVKNPSL